MNSTPRFFSVPYDIINDFKIRRLMHISGGIVALGRWVALLGMLYDEHGLLDLNDASSVRLVAETLQLDDVDEFMLQLAECKLIDSELYRLTGHVVNHGVCDELEYKKTKSEAGKQGGRPKKQNKKQKEKQVL